MATTTFDCAVSGPASTLADQLRAADITIDGPVTDLVLTEIDLAIRDVAGLAAGETGDHVAHIHGSVTDDPPVEAHNASITPIVAEEPGA
jgi:hypothetical protein